MLHWYVAMGLLKQHHYQQVMLARVRDIGLPHTLVCVVQRFLCVGHASVWYLCKDEADSALLRRLWFESNCMVISELFALGKSERSCSCSGCRSWDCICVLYAVCVGFFVSISISLCADSGGEVRVAIRGGGSKGRSAVWALLQFRVGRHNTLVAVVWDKRQFWLGSMRFCRNESLSFV